MLLLLLEDNSHKLPWFFLQLMKDRHLKLTSYILPYYFISSLLFKSLGCNYFIINTLLLNPAYSVFLFESYYIFNKTLYFLFMTDKEKLFYIQLLKNFPHFIQLLFAETICWFIQDDNFSCINLA